MHAFVVVASKTGRPLNQELLERVRQADLPELFFAPTSHLFWTNTSGSVAFCGWQAATDIGRLGSHWYADPDGLTAFDGHLWPKAGMWAPDRTWAEQLADYWRIHGVLPAYESLFGIYSAVHLSSEGPGFVVSDPFSVGLLYRSETNDALVISNRTALAARAVTRSGQRPLRDALTCAWLPYFGHLVGEGTGFVAVEILPYGTYVELPPAAGPSIRSRGARTWEFAEADPQRDDPESLIGLVHADLLANVRGIASLPVPRKVLRVSGGKDSRLILALMLEAGVHDAFSFLTIGPGHAADVIVAKHLGEAFGLNLSHRESARLERTAFEKRLRIHSFQTGGVVTAWDLKGGLEISREVTVAGHCAELMRSVLGSGHAAGRSIDSANDVYDFFLKRYPLDSAELLREDARDYLRDEVRSCVSGYLEQGIPPADIPDVFYLENKHRWWFAALHQPEVGLWVYPLQSLVGQRTAFRLGARWRMIGRLNFELLRRANTALAKQPLAENCWHEEVHAHLPDTDEYRAAAPVQSEGSMPTKWQLIQFEQSRDLFERYLVEDRTNPIFTVLDPVRVETAVRGERPLTRYQLYRLYGALTAAVWLGHHERSARVGEQTAREASLAAG